MNRSPSPDLRLLPAERAATLLGPLEFVLVHDARLSGECARAGSHLVVALRDGPTHADFDPERLTLWLTSGDKGQPVELRRSRALPERSDVAWGPVRVSDRLEAHTSFLTFGGVVRAFQPDAATTIVILDSAAPILRLGGHGHEVEPMASEAAVFFARLRVPIESRSGAEGRIGHLSPVALYAGFIADLHARYQGARALRELDVGAYAWLAHEARRLESTSPADWDEARCMLSDLDVLPATTFGSAASVVNPQSRKHS